MSTSKRWCAVKAESRPGWLNLKPLISVGCAITINGEMLANAKIVYMVCVLGVLKALNTYSSEVAVPPEQKARCDEPATVGYLPRQ